MISFPKKRKWMAMQIALFVVAGSLCSMGKESASAAEWKPWLLSNDPVAQMWQKVDAGEISFSSSSEQEVLIQFLKELQIPVESQVMVFTKTSFQNSLITTKTPRALYYNEEVYVAYVPGGMLEIIAIDPQNVPQFYTMSMPKGQASHAAQHPVLKTNDQCLGCHDGVRTQWVPGMIARSMVPTAGGGRIRHMGAFLTRDSSPLSERWGGWYVTGKHGDERHMGNVYAKVKADGEVEFNRDAGANLDSVAHLIEAKHYPLAKSDIVSLMVMEHQFNLENSFTAARRAIQDYQKIQDPEQTLEEVLQEHQETLLKKLVFAEEISLEGVGLEGDPSFQEAFRAQRIQDSQGRSLKDFDLSSRLFKHRISYMIQSRSFDHLPEEIKKPLLNRIKLGLTSDAKDPLMTHLSEQEKDTLHEILSETLPSYAEIQLAAGL